MLWLEPATYKRKMKTYVDHNRMPVPPEDRRYKNACTWTNLLEQSVFAKISQLLKLRNPDGETSLHDDKEALLRLLRVNVGCI